MAKQHDERRREIIDHARTLFFTRGYDITTVHDVIDAVGIAKGTFYHYFRGKADLLAAMIDVMADEIIAGLEPVVNAPGKPAADRIVTFFQESLFLKSQQPEMLVLALRTLYRPENVLLRTAMTRRNAELVGPLLAQVIRDGIRDGEFRVADPDLLGAFIIESFSTLTEQAVLTLLENRSPEELIETFHRTYDFMEWTLERMLGLPEGSTTIADRESADRLVVLLMEDLDRTPIAGDKENAR